MMIYVNYLFFWQGLIIMNIFLREVFKYWNETAIGRVSKNEKKKSKHDAVYLRFWNLKNDINSPKLYEFIIKIELKGDTTLDVNNFYNNINISLDAVKNTKEDLIRSFQQIIHQNTFEIIIFLHLFLILINTLI